MFGNITALFLFCTLLSTCSDVDSYSSAEYFEGTAKETSLSSEMPSEAPRKTAANVSWRHHNGCTCRDFEITRAEHELAGPVHQGYIVVDDQLRTSLPGVWALGDCNGKGAFTHTSYNDYEIVAANLFDNDPRRVSDRITVADAARRSPSIWIAEAAPARSWVRTS